LTTTLSQYFHSKAQEANTTQNGGGGWQIQKLTKC